MKLHQLAVIFSLFFTHAALAGDLVQKLNDMNALIGKGELQGLVAKEMCSCRYVSGLTLEQCKEKSNLPSQLFMIIGIDDYVDQKTIVATPKIVNQLRVEARFNSNNPRKGCRITFGRLNYK